MNFPSVSRYAPDSRSYATPGHWLDLLKRTERTRPVALPVGTDIVRLSLGELQAVAQHTYRVQRYWSSARPSIRHPVRSKPYGPTGVGAAAILSVVPGTSLAILYTRETTRQLICCDLDAPHLAECRTVGHLSRKAHYNKPGLHLIALAVRTNTHSEQSLCVFGIEHVNGRAATLKEYFRAPLHTPCKALFICEDVIGVIPYPEDETCIHVHATNFLTNVSVTVLIEVGYPINNFSYLFCAVHDATSPCIVVTSSCQWEFEVYRCPADHLPLSGAHGFNESSSHEGINNSRIATINVEKDRLRADDEVHDSESAEIRWSPMGFHAIIVEYSHETAHPTTFARFWPTGNEDAPATISLKGKVGSHATSRDSPWLLASSPSGRYTVMVFDRTHDIPHNSASEPSLVLYLLQFFANPDTVETRLLDFPSFISLDEIYSVAIDERCGVVYLVHEKGDLLAIPYA